MPSYEGVVTGRAGRLTVVSLGAKVVWAGSRLMISRIPPLRGTAIEIDFRPDRPVENPDAYVSVF
jgi:hypothetical protein